MKRTSGLTMVEIIIAMLLLAILGSALIAFLPMITRTTQAASIDTTQSQRAISIFESIAFSWSNQTPWTNNIIYKSDGTQVPVLDFISTEMAAVGLNCVGDIQQVAPERKRVVITCPATDSLPETTLRAEFGDPGA